VNSCQTLGARFSITVRMNASVTAAIAAIDEDAWTPIEYPKAVWDDEGRCWISDAAFGANSTRIPCSYATTGQHDVRRARRRRHTRQVP
jgi:hypothetical protein